MATSCVKRFITSADIKAMNVLFEDYKGISEVDYDYFIKTMNSLIRKDKWAVNDLRYLKRVIAADNARPHLEYIFLVLNNHPQWHVYFKDLVLVLSTETIAKLQKEAKTTPDQA